MAQMTSVRATQRPVNGARSANRKVASKAELESRIAVLEMELGYWRDRLADVDDRLESIRDRTFTTQGTLDTFMEFVHHSIPKEFPLEPIINHPAISQFLFAEVMETTILKGRAH